MKDLIQEIWFLKRDIVSDDFDRALLRLSKEVPMTIHEVPSGTRVWTWTIPEKWTCHEAYLESLDGQRLLDYKDHPLHVVSYSLPFEGEVHRDELYRHLHVHPEIPDAIPFVFKYYQRDWGLCSNRVLKDSLNDDIYKVVIKTEFSPGALKIGEIVVPGEVEDCFVVAAHLDHPAMVNDDLTGVAVGLYTARRLLAGAKPHFTYRFLFFPETLGSIAYLSQNEDLIPSMKGGLFLEMLGNDASLALQTSFRPDSPADVSLVTALRGLDPGAYVGPYRTIIDNDERQFNSPGVRIPMLSLSRVENPHLPESRFLPYREYHSSLDTPDIISEARLQESVEVATGLLQAFDRNRYVINHFKGEVFASGYGIWVDYREDPEGHKLMFEIMERLDGSRRPADIAMELNVSFDKVWELVEMLMERRLVSLSDVARPTDPHLR
jgi:aminopeptidase-like protein